MTLTSFPPTSLASPLLVGSSGGSSLLLRAPSSSPWRLRPSLKEPAVAPHSPAAHRRGGGGRAGFGLAPPWLSKGRALQQRGLKSDGRRYSCGVSEEGWR